MFGVIGGLVLDGTGSSYSGGTGGGGLHLNYEPAGGDTGNGYSGSANGATGGIGRGKNGSSTAGGGTGNPGGNGASGTGAGNNGSYKGNDGTGGLLTIYCDTYNNLGTIESRGVNSRSIGGASGGASGGGSINIFYNTFVQNNSWIVSGGSGANYGGSGGSGTATKGNVSSGTFVKE